MLTSGKRGAKGTDEWPFTNENPLSLAQAGSHFVPSDIRLLRLSECGDMKQQFDLRRYLQQSSAEPLASPEGAV